MIACHQVVDVVRRVSARWYSPHALVTIVLLAVVVGTACTGSGGPAPASVPVPVASDVSRPTPAPIDFPRDEAPHDNLIEWWYYTGHLETPRGDRYGFEFVIFQAIRGRNPVGYVAHVAVTDHQTRTFTYDQRAQMGTAQAAGDDPTERFDLSVGDWRMRGANGVDSLKADFGGEQPGQPRYQLDLLLVAQKPPALHNNIGYISFGPAGDSYYYSRTRIAVDGTLQVGAERFPVTGRAWMDHQWGDFISAGGGWDWFSVQLDDGNDLTLSIVRDDAGTIVFSYGMAVAPDGETLHLEANDLEVIATDRWASPRTGVVYPSGWEIRIKPLDLRLTLDPVLRDQELDTRETTGVIYWEGEVTVRGERECQPVQGEGYVELNGYAQ